uniref:Uncharacterized protein n=1 Tax=viral metagenome TaxID=1070528 RepID=A0A6M3LHW4_9ZZZZ
MNREHLMSRWDAWRQYIAEGGKGSWPRDEFEMLLDYFMEPCVYSGICEPASSRDCKDCPHGGENDGKRK